MARMIPAIIPTDTQSEAEKLLFPILREKLDDSFIVFHSLKLLTHNREEKFMEGEIDYFLFSPNYGLLVLEVKSGIIRYDGSTACWYQNERVMSKSPFDQASAAKYQLLEFLSKQLGFTPAITLSHAVCFPDVAGEMNNLPTGAEPELCITAAHLTEIDKTIIRIMRTFQKSAFGIPDKRTFQQIHQVLMPCFEYGTTMADQLNQDDKTILALTEGQCRYLDFIHQYKEALIQGCAGSGKTIMAIKKARELAAQGNSVLFLAYNEMLGQRLAESVKDLPGITASTYHDFCIHYLKQAGCLPLKSEGQQYWEKDIPEAFADYIRMHPLKYDAVIVDEGQDFRLEYWVTIEELRKEGSYFYVFYDPDQNLYGTEMQLPINSQPFVLNENCRNTRNIFQKLRTFSSRPMDLKPGAPLGKEVQHYHGDTERNRRRNLRDILVNLIEDQGLKPEQIVVLGGHSLQKTCLAKGAKLSNYVITEGTEAGLNMIRYHTYMKFKGCEADAVILLDVDKTDPRWSDLALYTAISRAKHLLYIIWKE